MNVDKGTVNIRSQSSRSPAPAPVPLERYYRVADRLALLASPRKLALLDVLCGLGPMPLGVAIFQGGMATHGALRDAVELEALGLVTVDRPTGRNLSEIVAITPEGRRVIALVRVWVDHESNEPNRTELQRGHAHAEDE